MALVLTRRVHETIIVAGNVHLTILSIDRGTLKPGAVADVTVIDPDAEWTIDPGKFRSKSRNTPYAGWKVRGRADAVLVGGKIKFEAGRGPGS